MTPVGLLAAVLLSIGDAGQPVIAAQAAAPPAPMAVKVAFRSGSGAFQDTALVYLDGRIDAGAPDRLSKALSRPSSHAPSIGVSVDIDESSALMVRTFLGSCLRRQAKK